MPPHEPAERLAVTLACPADQRGIVGSGVIGQWCTAWTPVATPQTSWSAMLNVAA
jgi:hypothetical protein